jgi:hypothetical protein
VLPGHGSLVGDAPCPASRSLALYSVCTLLPAAHGKKIDRSQEYCRWSFLDLRVYVLPGSCLCKVADSGLDMIVREGPRLLTCSLEVQEHSLRSYHYLRDRCCEIPRLMRGLTGTSTPCIRRLCLSFGRAGWRSMGETRNPEEASREVRQCLLDICQACTPLI